MTWRHAALGVALFLCGPWARGESFVLPELPAPLKRLLHARISNAEAIMGSLSAHPLGEHFLDEILGQIVADMPDAKVDALTALRIVCCTLGNDSFGIFAVGRYVARFGTGDGFLAWMVSTQPHMRASCRAFSLLERQGSPPSPPPGSRVAVFARLSAAAQEATDETALRDTLYAWGDAVDATQSSAAAMQARALLDGSLLHSLLPVLAYDPMPPALSRGLAEALEKHELQRAMRDDVTLSDLLTCVTAIARFARAEDISAELLRVADAAATKLPQEIRVYLTLSIAARLIQQFDLDAAAARLDAAMALDESGAQRENLARLLAKCRAGEKS